MSNFTIEDSKEILINYKDKPEVTDFAVLLGAYRDSTNGHFQEWTRESMGDVRAKYIASSCGVGSTFTEWYLDRTGVFRPVLDFSETKNIPRNFFSKYKEIEGGFVEVEYGFYLQTAVKIEMQKKLTDLYSSDKLKLIGNVCTVDSEHPFNTHKKFKKREIKGYEYEGKIYARVEAIFSSSTRQEVLNGTTYSFGDYVWVEVEPIKWIVNLQKMKMITKNGVLSGIQLSDDNLALPSYKDDKDFNRTNIKKFLDEFWSIDIQKFIYKLETTKKRKSRLECLNPDITPEEIKRNMTDTEIIHNWIENGESLLLRGPSGIGKTERIRTLYPDLIELKLTNNMFPEKVIGSTNIQTGEDIPPNYVVQVILKSATEEERVEIEKNIQNIYRIADQIYERSKTSDKKIVILLDELLNVNPNIQSLVYTLVLNRFIEIGSGIKLPKNVVVVATGNSKRYSNVAEDLVKPLEKRFDHILDMKPKVGEWISEYAIPNNIHPAVIGYIISKYNTSFLSEKISDMGYFFEEPEIGEMHLDEHGNPGRTNDPRGWTAISNMLYNFEENLKSGKYDGKDIEDILYRTLDSKLRLEWANEFYNFYNQPLLTPEEVVNKEYTEEDLPVSINERFACMAALLSANESQVEVCRKFIRKYCDPEYLAIYDIYWAGSNERRMEIIGELDSLDAILLDSEDMKNFSENGIKDFEKIGSEYKSYIKSRDDERIRS